MLGRAKLCEPGQQLGAVDPRPARPLDPRVSMWRYRQESQSLRFQYLLKLKGFNIKINNSHVTNNNLGGTSGFLGARWFELLLMLIELDPH